MENEEIKREKEEKFLISNVEDKIDFCKKRNKIQITNFLNIQEQMTTKKYLKKYQNNENIKYFFTGGSKNSERKILVIYPLKLEELIEQNKLNLNSFISVIRIKLLAKEDYGKYSHRTYLGGLMKLGIERDSIGDIIVYEDGADIICTKLIEKSIINEIQNLTRFRNTIVEKIKLEEIHKKEEKQEFLNIIVNSLRIDSIISEILRCSRTKASQLILEKRVYINQELVNKYSKEVKLNEEIVIRGKGKYYLDEISGNTKKGKIKAKIKHLI